MFWMLMLLVLGAISYAIKQSMESAGRSDDRPVKVVSMTAPSGPAPTRGFVEDATFGDATAKRLRSDLMSGTWTSTDAALQGKRDWAEREMLVDALCEFEVFAGREKLFDAWCAARPQSSLPYLLRGAWRISAAWKARGTGTAKTVSQNAFMTFFALLNQADLDLITATELDKDDPTPHALRITAARGRQQDKETVRALFDEVVKRDPHHRKAHAQMMTALCAKWSGSHEAMFAFARETVGKAPQGSVLGGLVAMAHAERYLYASGFAESAKDDPQWYGKAGEYFKDAQVKADLLSAYERSLGSPAFKETPTAVHSRNAFAWCFHMAGDTARARVELEKLGKRLTQVPWSWSGRNPMDVCQKARAACGLPPA